MRFGILKAGTATRRTRERAGDVDAQFTALLAEPGQTWQSFDVEHGEFPADVGAFNALLVTGSAASVYDDEPWIARLLEALRTAHRRQVPLLGICFGLQAVAQALGGRVEPNPLGWELGLAELELSEAGRRWPPLAGAPRPLRILESHSDIAVALPPGAVVLASSRRTPVEVFSLGERVLCLQGHPEMDREMVRELVQKRLQRGLLDAARAAEGLASLQAEPPRAFLAGWLRTFLREGRIPAAA
jgi:GMP synthase-like glutamine amidotransferase